MLGRARFRLGKRTEALADLNESVRLARNARNLSSRGYALAELGRVDQALADVDEALALDRGRADVWGRKGRVHLRRGELDQAVRAYDEALRLEPEADEAYADRAEAKEGLGDFAGAALDYQAALRANPALQQAKDGLARVEGRRGRSVAQAPDAAAPAIRAEPLPPPAPPPPPSPPPPDRDTVRRAQAALAALGHDVGAADGALGRRTRAALDGFRRSAGLPADAPLDGALVGAIERAAVERLAAERARAAAEAEARLREEARQRAEAGRQAAEQTRLEAERRAKAEAEERARLAAEQREKAAAAAFAAAAPRPDPSPQPAPIPSTAGGTRVALVIGNGAYRHTRGLPNPPNDAADVAALLARLGFAVMSGTDLDRAGMEDLMIRYAKAAARAEVALAFYAGHGVQVEGTNYLLPTDAAIEDEVDLRRLIRLDDMVRDTGRAGRLGLVVVDACRDNPFEAELARAFGPSRSVGAARGLAAPVVPPRTLVAYATAATRTAEDGAGRNSPFTAALLRHLPEPEEVRFVFGEVADAVWEASQGRQRPEIWTSLGGERLYLVRAEAVAEALDAELTAGERRAVQRSLARLGLYAGAEDGRFTPALRGAVRDFQARSGAVATGFLTVQQIIALHGEARHRGPPEPLPPVDVIDLLRRTEAGEPAAARLRGNVHDRAYGPGPLPKDMAEAARWYRKAAEAGDADAALALGRILRDGEGVEPDPAEAARWLRAAADAGRPEAQYALGELHRDGTGVPGDAAEAARLFRLAAAGDRGEAVAQLRALGAW